MKLIHLSQTDAGAGAGRAAYRIHRALLELGVDSRMLVADKRTVDPTVSGLKRSGLSRARVCEWLEARNGHRLAVNPHVLFSPASYSQFDAADHPDLRTADVVNLYWINGGFVSPENLARIGKPLVWRLSDVWPFTGGCHYAGGCNYFETQCGNCPQLCRPGPEDAAKRLWQRKQEAWRSVDLTVAAPSNWMAGLARRSSLFANRRIEVIPTGVDLERYRPEDRRAARGRWGLPQDRLLVLFGAMNSTDDLRKGYRELRQALEVLSLNPLASRIQAVVFGSDSPLSDGLLPMPAVSLGRLEGDEALAAAYNCADVVVVPSLEDNLPNVALEAIACGTPVVAFNVCGMPDIVVDGRNGRLIPSVDPVGMGQALIEMLSDSDRLMSMRASARRHACQRFSLERQAKAYLELYRQIIAGHTIENC